MALVDALADAFGARYDRAALQPGIVHLGLGAFARAHLCALTDAAIAATQDMRWGVVGVSLRHADVRDALEPQGGLYTLKLRAERETSSVIGCVTRVLVAPEDPQAVMDAIAVARIVSLTVTEKGYCHDPATRKLRFDHEDITHDLAHPHAPGSALGFIAQGLQRRRAAGAAGLTLLSCDNLPGNGDTLRALLLAFAGRLDADLATWIGVHCSFPNSMVDRIVPRTPDSERGANDAWPVIAEPFLDWALEDRFVAGRPAWDGAGARFVERAEPFERLKLRMVNGCHSTLAYVGLLAGYETVDQALADPALRRLLDELMREEIAPTLRDVPADLDAYRERLLERFANPALAHRLQQIAMDGSQKLPQRLLGTIRDRRAAGQGIERLALGVAAWLRCLQVRRAQIVDPLAQEVARDGLHCSAVFADLGRDEQLAAAVSRQMRTLP